MIDKQELEVLETLFSEQNFEYGDEPEVVSANLALATKMYEKAYADAEQIATLLEDGLCFDKYDAILSIQILGLSERFIKRFKEQMIL